MEEGRNSVVKVHNAWPEMLQKDCLSDWFWEGHDFCEGHEFWEGHVFRRAEIAANFCDKKLPGEPTLHRGAETSSLA